MPWVVLVFHTTLSITYSEQHKFISSGLAQKILGMDMNYIKLKTVKLRPGHVVINQYSIFSPDWLIIAMFESKGLKRLYNIVYVPLGTINVQNTVAGPSETWRVLDYSVVGSAS